MVVQPLPRIEVKSAPVVTWPGPLPPVCQGSAPVILSGATPTGGVYRVNGLISGNFDPSMYPPGLVNLSYTYTDPITECSAYATNSVSVISGPTIFNVTGGGSYAPGDPGVIVGLDGSQVDVVYQLHINGIQTGISLWGSGTSISFGYQVIPGIYTVIATNAITNCISVMANSAVVTQGTSVAWPNPLPNLCRNAGSYILTGGLPEGGTYSGTGVENGVFNPELCPEFYTWYETYTLTYSYSDNEGNTSSATNTITLYQVPVVTWNSPLMSVCINASPIWLIGGTPAGGVYSGPGVFGCIFDASIAGIGMHSLTYTYTDYTSGCSGIVTRTITVTPLPENVTAGPDITINSGSSTTLNGTASPEGGPYSYSWEPTTGLSDPNIPNPVASPSETTTYTLVVTNMNGCSASDQVTVTVGNGYSINGQVLYAKPPPELLPIENMLLHLANGNGTVIQSVTTDAEGNYQFTDVPEGIYTILPGNNLPWSNVVVNSIDLLLYQRVILGLTSLGDFYLQAGKVDNENAVNSYDLYLIQTRILGLIDSFTTGDWLFEDASLTVSGGNQVKNLNALMYGDANASYYPTTGTPCPGIPSF
ncbi:MAG: hypothetical protein NTU44_08905, partial [Bacteroidetes bacterium]|nr:hypothetical protein [Bacteroidota bacterium]